MNTYRRGAEPDARRHRRKQIAAARIPYLEGYLWDPANAKEAFVKAATCPWRRPPGRADLVGCVLRRSLPRRIPRSDVHRRGRSGLRQRGRAAFPAPDVRFRRRAEALRNDIKLGVVTRSEKGCVVVSKDGIVARRLRSTGSSTPPAPAICSPRDSCSAWRAMPDTRCARRLGALAAAEVIQHLGARPQTSLKDFAQQNGLLV